MLSFDKSEIRNSLSVEDIFGLVEEWGGEPEYTDFGFISATICHNEPGDGSRKLYYYQNSDLFHCYTGCENPSFDIFELTIKIFSIQNHKNIDLNDAVRFIAFKFGIFIQSEEPEEEQLQDWKIFDRYERIQNIEIKDYNIQLKEYDNTILDRLNYKVKILPWLEEGITEEVMKQACIGYYAGGNQITIPHYDIDGRFIGLRGRTLSKEEAELYGKYRPIIINKTMYAHPLGMNLYGLNTSKDNIKTIQKAIVFESEKSHLLYSSHFGIENNISVACCGSNLSAYQIQMLAAAGAKEIIVAFDKQFISTGTAESRAWANKLTSIYKKYKNYIDLSFIWDKNDLLNYKSSPIDEGKEKFLQLFKERVVL